jgi:hypothetical protein
MIILASQLSEKISSQNNGNNNLLMIVNDLLMRQDSSVAIATG